MIVDLVFPATGADLPIDHAYQLFAALSHTVPQFHDAAARVRFAPITGVAVPEGRLELNAHSHLVVRLPDDAIKLALPLAGKRLQVGEGWVRLGVPAVRTLVPAPALIARIVTFKNADTPEQFLATARTKLADLGVSGEPQLPIHVDGLRAGEPKRRVLRVKDAIIPGYALLVTELSAADSLRLQEDGLGGRTSMGCGFFTPAKGAK
jgi:CRISPR-associated protein Cas6